MLPLLIAASWLIISQASESRHALTTPEQPRWRELDSHQHTLTREEFESALEKIYSPHGAFQKYITVSPEKVIIYNDLEKTKPLWTYYFATEKYRRPPWKQELSTKLSRELRGASWEQPLKGLTICLDPGHIGGEWANIEERYFRIRRDEPIVEGELNMVTCRHTAKLLEQAGARVVWTKEEYEPATDLRPDDFNVEGIEFFLKIQKRRINYRRKKRLREQLRLSREMIFYRSSEITARAERVNQELRPDLTICVHFNAAPWRYRRKRLLKGVNKLILFVHGSYHPEEVKYDKHKFHLMRKMLEKSSDEEISAAEAIARQMHAVWGWSAQKYDTRFANRVSENPYVWSRNLIANRLYDGPVVFVEGPFMNDRAIYPRLKAGDYDGEKKINGKMYKSIFREYAQIIADGIIHHYMGIP